MSEKTKVRLFWTLVFALHGAAVYFKLTGAIDWSWWAIAAPAIAFGGAAVGVLLLVGALIGDDYIDQYSSDDPRNF